MSSRLLRGAVADAPAVAWRTAGSAPSAPAASGAAPAAPAPAQTVEAPDCEARVAEAYRRGRADGEGAATRLAEERAGALAAPVLANFGAMVQELAGARRQARQEAEESMVQLALAIARRILHREIATDPEAILGLVRTGLDRVNARELHRLRLSAGDAAMVEQNRGEMGIPPAVEVAADRTLPPGSAVFETARGEMDVSVQTQLEEIERGFADLVIRRRRA